MLSQNFAQIQKSMMSIENMELEKPHPDTKFNQDSQIKENEEAIKTVQGKMDDIKRFYINLQKEDEEFEQLQTKVDNIKSAISKTKTSLAEISKKIVGKNNENKQEGNVSDDEWNKQFGFVLSA